MQKHQEVWGSKDVSSDLIKHSKSFRFKTKITRSTSAVGNGKNVEIAVPLKSLSNFWKTLEIPLINCLLIYLLLTWLAICAITNSTNPGTFIITKSKLYVPVVTLSPEDNTQLLGQLESGFKRIIIWSKYRSDVIVNRLFVLLFENNTGRTE